MVSNTLSGDLISERYGAALYDLASEKKCIDDILKDFELVNKALKERLFSESKNIFERVNEIHKIAGILNNKAKEKLNFSSLLIEITKRILNENKFESNLFFL